MKRDETGARRSSFARRYLNEYRIASYLLVLFAAGHTFGAVVDTPDFGAEGNAVAATMKTVLMPADGATCTWYGFYRGFGIYVSVFFVLSALVTWFIGGMGPRERALVAPITWTLFFGYAATIVIDVMYFFTAPTAFSVAVTIALGVASVRTRWLQTTTAKDSNVAVA